MMIRVKSILFVCLFSFCFFLSANNTQHRGAKYWVFFVDKGQSVLAKKSLENRAEALNIKSKAIERRLKVLKEDQCIDYRDYPVSEIYIQKCEDMGLSTIAQSRWLNSISVFIPDTKLDQVNTLPFVNHIQRVSAFEIIQPLINNKEQDRFFLKTSQLDYGSSYDQNAQINVPLVHDLGINGKGVLIGNIDSGFDHSGRSVFFHLDIIDEWDFHWNDPITTNEVGDPSGQHSHGTRTLSVMGGYQPGTLIGPAYGASYLLGKTEWISSETKIEEDHWVEAIEWMERNGADIVTTSLGYALFDVGVSYAYEDLDGNTCVTTVAADIAAEKGVTVVASAGNERDDPWYYITSPADGDSVIAVGAVNSSGNITGFSSAGPTSDGRIKPDVVAMGQSVVSTSVNNPGSVDYVNGTSFSAPLVAGVCAMVLQAHPELGPMDVREALRETADLADDPNNLYGWGLVNAYAAVFYHGVVFTNINVTEDNPPVLSVDVLWKNAIQQDSVFLFYRQSPGSFISLKLESETGETNRYQTNLNTSLVFDELEIYFTAKDDKGDMYTVPLGAPDNVYNLSEFLSDTTNYEEADETALYQNYPNPFNPKERSTCIPFGLTETSHIKIKIYNILGQEIFTVVDGLVIEGIHEDYYWDGKNYSRNYCASGLYFARLNVNNDSFVIKMICVR